MPRWTIAEPLGSIEIVWAVELAADQRAGALPGVLVASLLDAPWMRLPTWQATDIASFLGRDVRRQQAPRESALEVVRRALGDGSLLAFRRSDAERQQPAPGPGPAPAAHPAPAAPRPRPDRPPAAAGPAYGVSNVEAPEHIAPGAETVDIRYVIDDQARVIAGGTLELLAAGDDAPIWTRPLGPGEIEAGERTIRWDGGGLPVSERFPDGFVTFEGSPYRFRISVDGSGRAKHRVAQSAPVKVGIASFTVTLAPRACLENEDERAVWDQIGRLGGTAPILVKLDGNVFAFEGERPSRYDDVGHEQYWKQQDRGAGPRIPLIATILVTNSQGKSVRAGNAIGRARVVWDFRDAHPANAELGRSSRKAAAYLAKLAAYKRGDGGPLPSDNAHRDFGGKRGTSGPAVPPVLGPPDAWVHDFPFKAEAGATRSWAAFAAPIKSGPRAGEAGVVFRPAITAGDSYLVTAHVDATGGTLDVKTPPKLDTAGAIASAYVGTFEVWRRLTLAKLVKKTPFITALVPSVQSFFNDAYIDVPDTFNQIEVLTKTRYDELFAKALQRFPGPEGPLRDHAFDRTRSQYDLLPLAPGPLPYPFVIPTPWVVTFRSYEDFKQEVRKAGKLTEEGLAKKLGDGKLDTLDAYRRVTEDWGHYLAMEIARSLVGANGVTVVQFDHISSIHRNLTQRMVGVAVQVDRQTGNRQRTAFVQFEPISAVFAHELGHCLFLPHAPTVGSLADRIMDEEPERHDAADTSCLMSYSDEITGFCGQCLLRLRGWNGNGLDSRGAKTTGK